MDSAPRPSRALRILRRLSTFHTVECIVFRHQNAVEIPVAAELAEVTPDNVEDARSMDSPSKIEEFRSFLARGDRGWYAYLGGRVVHRSWLVRGPATMRLWHRFGAWPVAAGEAYLHYCETSPEARGHGIYPAALSHIARGSSFRNLFIATELANQASRRGIEKAGFVERARVTVRVAFGIGWQGVAERVS